MSSLKYQFKDIRKGCIFIHDNNVYVKTSLIEHRPDYYIEYSNAINRHGRHVEIEEDVYVKAIGHLDEYQPEVQHVNA